MMISSAPSKPLSPHEATREKNRRRLAKSKMIAFTEYISPWYQTERAHKLICRYLDQVALYVRTRGKSGIGRLIIEMIPQGGKSELVSKHFPAFILGREPNAPIQLLSYGGDLASKNSKKAKEIVEGSRYQALFGHKAGIDDPVMLAADSRAASVWNLAPPNRGGVVAAGVGGGVTGLPSWLTVIDDFFKNREQAESEAYRKRVWEFWESVAERRLAEWAAVVTMMTRWHADDFIGMLLKQEASSPRPQGWVVLSLPGLAFKNDQYAKSEEDQKKAMMQGRWLNLKDPLGRSPGEAVVPGRFSRDYLEGVKANLTAYEWASLYQQQPSPMSGGFFGREWKVVDKAPEGLQWVRYWDLAVSEKKTADKTACAAVAVDVDGNWFIRDMVKGRWEWPETRKRILEIEEIEIKTTIFGIEDVAFQKAAFQDLRGVMSVRGRILRAIVPENDKFVRAIPLQAAQELGKVSLVRGPWIGEFIVEALGFKPDGTSAEDDQIDTVTGGMQMNRTSLEGQLFF